MKVQDQIVALLFSIFLLLLWLGFIIHRSDSFAGSFWGGVLAISGATLLFAPLAYSIIKRIPLLKRNVVKSVSFATLLNIHIYAGFIGAILILLHTGHKFHGLLPTTLTAILLVLVFSGYVGRYLLSCLSKELSEKRQLLSALQSQCNLRREEFRDNKDFFRLTDSIADVEYAISTHEVMKRIFSVWLKFHLVLSFAFYLLLVIHIGGAYYFGLRWFS